MFPQDYTLFMALLTQWPAATVCGCDCADAQSRIPLAVDPVVLSGWSCCECQCCGIPDQGCTVQCSDLLRIWTTAERGKDTKDIVSALWGCCDKITLPTETKKEYPKFCGDCRDHGLLDLRRKATQQRRKRCADKQEDSAAKRVHKASASSSEKASQENVQFCCRVYGHIRGNGQTTTAHVDDMRNWP